MTDTATEARALRDQVARIISIAKGPPETDQTSVGAWWWDARYDRSKPEHFEGESRDEDRRHADIMIPLLQAALSTPTPAGELREVVEAAYAETWKRYPGAHDALAFFIGASGLRAGEITPDVLSWAREVIAIRALAQPGSGEKFDV